LRVAIVTFGGDVRGVETRAFGLQAPPRTPLMQAQVDPAKAGSDTLQLPWDLADWMSRGEIASWVREEIESLNWSNPELIAYLKAHANYHPRMMLNVLTFAYATGVLESEEILRRCDSDALYRQFCTEAAPESISAIRKFRRDNRGLLKWSLMQVLKRALLARFQVEQLPFPAGLKRFLLDNALSRLELARQLDGAVH
jgi:transposase